MDKKRTNSTTVAKYNVFWGTDASSIISNVTQYINTKNCDRHTHCFSLITVHYYGQGKKYNVVFITNVMETGLKL